MLMELTGSFKGHALPGVMFLIWALWWTGELVRKRGKVGEPGGPLEVGLAAPWGKVLVPLFGIWAEVLRNGLRWTDGRIDNHEHATMYLAFALTGVVDLLARRGFVSNRLTYLAFAGAALNAGFLFSGHTHLGGLLDTVHQLLILLFVGTAAVAVAEYAFPAWDLRWARVGMVYLLGTWLIQIAYMLYVFDYDLMDRYVLMKANLFFAWHTMAVAVVLLALRIRIGISTALSGEESRCELL
jgi:hypothetical protein